MHDCKDCQFFRKQTIEIAEVEGTFDTWINLEYPEGSGTFYDIAQCSNPLTTNEIISRDPATQFFFQEPYAKIFNDTPTAGELDECVNFTAI